ncbi:MAG TPA: DNA ligase D [Polyangiaceae bacterium]|nr:DNA ligase D [Polyangiaceae bacterium]
MPTLAKYRKMRDFSRTAEPRGEPAKGRKPATRKAPKQLSFVIQRHEARRLHYDFRLELGGVLLSWAVPKGPSLNPADKRLAVETEPHPLEYGKFEGTIPKGEYGAGNVTIWDHGTWEPEGDAARDFERGRLTFKLHGEKLNGSWHLVRTRTRDSAKDEKNWLLMKSRDEFADAGDGAPRGGSGRKDDGEPKSAPRQRASAAPARRRKTSTTIEHVEPELATLVSAAPEGDAWVHELKFDGYRLLARVAGGDVGLFTRHGHDWSERMPALVRALSRIEVDAWLDGEVVVLDERGVSNFQRLQNSLSEGQAGPLVFYVFDLLELDGTDYRNEPLTERKRVLAELWKRLPPDVKRTLRLSDHVVGKGPEFFEQACKLGVEGIVSKRADAPYRSGRGRDWLKVKCLKRQEFAIVGYTEPSGSRSHLGALLIAVNGPHGFRYAGRVGTGFTAASLAELHRALAPLARDKPPDLENAPRGADARGVHWVEPKLAAEVAFTEMTEDGVLRHPSFQGLREDKSAAEAREERPADVSEARPAPRGARAPRRAKTNDYPLSNPDKILYPEQGITKRELLDYYALVAERMLPHVKDRPLTLVRCPNGYDKPCFFQKHPGEGVPAKVRSVPIEEKGGATQYSVIDDVEGLFGLVQLGALEIHTWGSHADDAEHPDIVVFDLDPDPDVDFGEVCRAAQELRRVFEAAKLETFVKTAGGKGLHVCLPIAPELTWREAKDFTQRIAEEFVRRSPDKFVATVSKSKRRGKIFIDYLRNGRGATFVAPYSTRARKNAPIATPLEWDELGPKLKPDGFTLRNIAQRLAKQRHDPFERMAQTTQSLRALLGK